ncbi:MAG: 50S ribosomal protein L29 [Sandaracinaceae bacterium]|nr:50S ribosomal protein L29 [Sandaracinaceae bacterium]
MKAAELRERSDEELRSLEAELKEKLWQARFDNFTNQLDDTSSIRKIRRDIARVKGILTERAKQAAQEA